MSFNGSGVFNINTSGQPVVGGTTITATAFNALTADLATGLTTCLTKDGQTTATANIPMGTHKITGLAAATTSGDALSYGQAATVSTLTATGAATLVSTTIVGTTTLQQALEKVTISATAATGTINFDALTQAELYYTTNASGNWTLNVRGNSGTSLDSTMSTGQSLTIAFITTQGGTAYYQSAFTIDGSSVTPKWQGGVAPTSGNTSALDVYTYTIIKTGSAAFAVLAAQSVFA
jgi:hypothetical protein